MSDRYVFGQDGRLVLVGRQGPISTVPADGTLAILYDRNRRGIDALIRHGEVGFVKAAYRREWAKCHRAKLRSHAESMDMFEIDVSDLTEEILSEVNEVVAGREDQLTVRDRLEAALARQTEGPTF